MNPERDRRPHARSSSQQTPVLTEEIVSEYLKSHQDFLIRWLTENTTKEIVELFAKKLKDKNFMEDTTSSPAGLKRSLPGAGPGGLGFPENIKNSITSQIFRRYLEGDKGRKPTRKDRCSLQRMSEEDLFMELIRDIASELDINMLCHKILQNVSILTNSDRSSLFLVRGSRDNRHLVSKLFDVTESSTLEEVIHTERNEIKVPFGKGVVGIVAQTGEAINIADAYEDPRFNQEIDRLTGFRTHSILSMPIVNYEGEVIGVAQIINKISGDHEFTWQDEVLFRKYLIFCGIGLTNAQLFEMSVNEFKRNKLLLHLARGIFQEQTNLEKLVQKIMLDAQDLLKCEKCCVYLLEDTCERDPTVKQKRNPSSPVTDGSKPRTAEEVVFSKAFDLCAKDGTVTVPSNHVLAKSKTAHIAKFVVTTGEPVNVADADSDGRFGPGPFVDTNGNRIKAVLCMPIHNSEKNIIGVTQLLNKINGDPFNDNDVNIIEAFSIFTGLGIHNCQMYENACQLMAKQSVALEVLSFHASAHADETTALQNSEIPSAQEMCLYEYDFDDHLLDDDGTLKACMRMFLEADVVNSFKIPYDVVCRWLCTVKKNYRPVTYHNWRHAFNVCQSMFTILYTGELLPLFEPLEVFTLLAACLCHDLDHRGTNNAFQAKVASPLAMLYSTSVLEHHHFDHCIMILNSEGHNIFQSLSPDEYRRAIKLLEHAILSTDLALYFKKRGDFKKLVESGEKTFADLDKRALLRAMMMTACDVAAIAKPWNIQQEVAQLVMTEFFEQGDIERHQLGEQPIPMMDRNKKDELPKMQVGFIDAICTPVYKLFAVITEKLAPLYDGCESNRRRWQERADLRQARLSITDHTSTTSVTAQSDAKPQEDGVVHRQALSGPNESEQGVDPEQAVQPVVLARHPASNSQHQQTQTDEQQASPGPRQQVHAPRHQAGAGSHTDGCPLPRRHHRQPEESQLGAARSTATTTAIITATTTTSPFSSPLASPPSQHLSQASNPVPSSSHPSLRNGHENPPQSDRAVNRPSPPSSHHCHPAGQLFQRPPNDDFVPASSADCSAAFSRQNQPGSNLRQSQPPRFGASATDSERLGSSIKTQPAGTKHLHRNGHASAEQKSSSEACCPQNLISPWQQPPAHRKFKTLAQAEAEAQFSSSRNVGKTGVCVVS